MDPLSINRILWIRNRNPQLDSASVLVRTKYSEWNIANLSNNLFIFLKNTTQCSALVFTRHVLDTQRWQWLNKVGKLKPMLLSLYVASISTTVITHACVICARAVVITGQVIWGWKLLGLLECNTHILTLYTHSQMSILMLLPKSPLSLIFLSSFL